MTWISYTLSFLPGTIIRRARTSSTPPSSPAPGIRTSIKGEKHGRFLSLRCHIINSGVSGMLPFSYPGGGQIKDLRNHTRDGASQLTEAGPLPVMGGRVELLKNMRRHHTQRLPHGRRRSFHMAALLRSYQDITFLAGHQECRKNSLLGTSRTLPIMEHFSKCGLHSVSYSVIL